LGLQRGKVITLYGEIKTGRAKRGREWSTVSEKGVIGWSEMIKRESGTEGKGRESRDGA
jgi:hypothetical protein